jgi:type II secretory pathway pseudopilin PulG
MAIPSRRARFSLIELVTVVAILMVLAAIAIPNVRMAQLKAQRAEVPTNVNGMATAEVAYHSAFDEYVSLPQVPPTDSYHPVIPEELGKTARAWTPGTSFDVLGYAPDGDVRGTYQIADWVPDIDMLVSGFSNLDLAGIAYAYRWQIDGMASGLYSENPEEY